MVTRLNSNFTLTYCLFGGMKQAKTTDQKEYVCTSYGIGFNLCSEFSLPDGRVGTNSIIFRVDMSSSLHISLKERDILILDIGPLQGLDDTTLAAEAKYSINFSRSNKNFCLNLQFKSKYSETEKYPLCLRNFSGDFSANRI